MAYGPFIYKILFINIFAMSLYSISLVDTLKLVGQEQTLYEHCSFDELFHAGRICKVAGDSTQAQSFLKAALFKRPDDWATNWDLADLLLLHGDLRRGWLGFAHRWKHDELYQKKLWRGESLENKTIVVYCQWGLGDTFMYIRYLQLLKQRGATVVCVCQKPLRTLLSHCTYIDALLLKDDTLPEFDYQAPIAYLPDVLDTRLDTIPNNVPYIYVPQELCEYWHEELAADNKFKIGICWQGAKRDDPQTDNRSILLQELKPLLSLPDVSIYSLQQGMGTEQLETLSSEIPIHKFNNNFDQTHGPFMDTAAVMKNLDLVITIDTSIAHLSGALGVPTWVLLPYAVEWRFFLNRNDSPWYPTMRLFRQSVSGDWSN